MTGYLYRGKPDLEQINAAIMARRPKDGDYTTGRIDGQIKARPAKSRANRPLPMDNAPPHGTPRRADWDHRRGLTPCDECRGAKTAQKRKSRDRTAATT